TLIDQSQNKILSKQAKIATSFFDRLFGLLNPHNPRFLIFHTHFGIHTLFMENPIDVLLLDGERKVVKVRESLFPNRLFLYHPKFSTVIEMPLGTIKKYAIGINDKISIA
ncbi:hypothetical protein D4S03_00160, partial [bacterium]